MRALNLLRSLFVMVIIVVPAVSSAVTECNARIGVILPLTGPLSSMGTQFQMGVRLAADIFPETKCNLEIDFEDDQFDPKKSVAAFKRLSARSDIKAAICFASGPCNAIAPLAEKSSIPLIAVASDLRVNRGGRYVFRLDISPQSEATALVRFLEREGFLRIAAVVAQQDGISAGYSSLRRHSYYVHREIVKLDVSPGISDYRTIIPRLIASKPDVIFVGLLAGDAGLFSRQLREQGFNGQLIGMNFLEGEESLSSANGALEGIVFSNVADPATEFLRNFKKKWKSDPGFGASHGHDAALLLGQAISKELTLVSYLRDVSQFKGALGTFDAIGGNEFNIPVSLRTVKIGRFCSF